MNPQASIRNPQSIPVLVVGNLGCPEMADVAAVLRVHQPIVEKPDFAAAQAWLDSAGEAPLLIVLAQLLPGEFHPAELDAFRRLIPLARVVRVLGTWCEGEGRNGKPWPGTLRLYWYEAPIYLRRELRMLARGCRSDWSMPLTATDEDHLLQRPREGLAATGPIAVHATRFQTASAILDVLADEGITGFWIRDRIQADSARPAVCIWDATHCNDREAAELAELHRAWPEVPILALLDFPRQEDIGRALACGAAAVLSKPCFNSDLLAQLASLAGWATSGRHRDTA